MHGGNDALWNAALLKGWQVGCTGWKESHQYSSLVKKKEERNEERKSATTCCLGERECFWWWHVGGRVSTSCDITTNTVQRAARISSPVHTQTIFLFYPGARGVFPPTIFIMKSKTNCFFDLAACRVISATKGKTLKTATTNHSRHLYKWCSCEGEVARLRHLSNFKGEF